MKCASYIEVFPVDHSSAPKKINPIKLETIISLSSRSKDINHSMNLVMVYPSSWIESMTALTAFRATIGKISAFVSAGMLE